MCFPGPESVCGPRFETWLRAHEPNGKADHWRYRRKLENIPPHLWEAPPPPEEQKFDPLKAYAAHRQAILKTTPEMGRSPSGRDPLIALHMRKKGVTRGDVIHTIERCAPEPQTGQESRNRQRYAERAADYACGLPGGVLLARGAKRRKQEQQARGGRSTARGNGAAGTEVASAMTFLPFACPYGIFCSRYSKRVSMDEIAVNDCNLNITRYVSAAVPEEEIDLAAVHADLLTVEEKIKAAAAKHNAFLKELGLPPLPY